MHASSHKSVTRRSVAVLLTAAAIAAAVLVANGGGSSARAGSLKNGLSAYVVATNKGPLPACSSNGSDCGPANTVWDYIHVINSNPLTNERGGSRATVPNAFVINSIDEKLFADGVDQPNVDTTFTPPPNVAPFNSSSGRWPATVVCDGNPPCSDVQNPAILPGENTVALWAGFIHTTDDPSATWVFTYTIHGTLNGNPVDLTASSPGIAVIG